MDSLEPLLNRRGITNATRRNMIHIDIKKLGCFTKTDHRITGDRTGQRHSLQLIKPARRTTPSLDP